MVKKAPAVRPTVINPEVVKFITEKAEEGSLLDFRNPNSLPEEITAEILMIATDRNTSIKQIIQHIENKFDRRITEDTVERILETAREQRYQLSKNAVSEFVTGQIIGDIEVYKHKQAELNALSKELLAKKEHKLYLETLDRLFKVTEKLVELSGIKRSEEEKTTEARKNIIEKLQKATGLEQVNNNARMREIRKAIEKEVRSQAYQNDVDPDPDLVEKLYKAAIDDIGTS